MVTAQFALSLLVLSFDYAVSPSVCYCDAAGLQSQRYCFFERQILYASAMCASTMYASVMCAFAVYASSMYASATLKDHDDGTDDTIMIICSRV